MTILKICEKIKLYRNKKGLTQKALAAALFMDERNYAKFERGQKKSIDVMLLLSIADILEVDMANFIPRYNIISNGEPKNSTENISSPIDEFKACVSKIENNMNMLLEEQKDLKLLVQALQLQLNSTNGAAIIQSI